MRFSEEFNKAVKAQRNSTQFRTIIDGLRIASVEAAVMACDNVQPVEGKDIDPNVFLSLAAESRTLKNLSRQLDLLVTPQQEN